MSLTATAIILGLLVMIALKANWVRPGGAMVCVVFGVVIGASAAGPLINDVLNVLGASVWQTLQGM